MSVATVPADLPQRLRAAHLAATTATLLAAGLRLARLLAERHTDPAADPDRLDAEYQALAQMRRAALVAAEVVYG